MSESSRTEKATPKKKQDERKKGNIFQSKDVTNSLALVGLFLVLRVVGPIIYEYLKGILIQYLSSLGRYQTLDGKTAAALLGDASKDILMLCVPIAFIAAVLSILFNGIQTRFNFTMKQVKPKFSRLNPLQGLKKMFALKSLVELVKSIIKILIIGWILYTEINARLNIIIGMPDYSAAQSLVWMCDTIFYVVIKIGMVMAAFGVLDFFYQWWDYERQIRMTKQEIKDEFKQTEGDPQTKGRIREQQRRIASTRMIQKVPTADVIIRNPTHYAVALKYDPKKDKAPIVIAKGMDYLALKIIEVAEAHKIAITENRPLARALYETAELDQIIPEEYYQAVADVLAFVYNLRKRRKGV